MRTTSRIAMAFLAFLATSSTAYAGGLGLIWQTGTHEERAYYYRGKEQALEPQNKLNYGPGLEAMIGDQDDKIQGILRMSWVKEYQASNPDISGDGITHPDYGPSSGKKMRAPRQIGVLGLGIQWGVPVGAEG